MEIPESNLKPQQTGGLKLMTVFVVVLALHVVVIGGMTTYYLLKGGSSDSDMMGDKNHKGLKANADGTLAIEPQQVDTDKTTAATSTPAPDANSTASTATPAPAATPTPDQMASDAAPTPAAQSTPSAAVTTPSPLTPPPDVKTPAVVMTPSAPVTPATTAPVITSALTPAPATTDATPETLANGSTTYVVKQGDSFAKIAHHNHLTAASLMAANSLTSDKLSIGQKLIIPAKTTAPVAAAPVATAMTTADIATPAVVTPAPAPVKETATAPAPEKKAKSVASAKPAVVKSAPEHHTYTIVKGDTLTKIAHKFKTTPTALMAANGIADPTKLKIGTKLTIPAKEAHTATTTNPAPVQPAQVETKKAAAQLANNVQ